MSMRNITNLQFKPSITRVLRHNTCLAQEPISTRSTTMPVLSSRDEDNSNHGQLEQQNTSVDKDNNGGGARIVKHKRRRRKAIHLISGGSGNGRCHCLPPNSFPCCCPPWCYPCCCCISIINSILALLLLLMLLAFAAMDTAIALASIVMAAIVVALAASTAGLPTTLPSMQPSQWLSPWHLLQPSLPSLPLPPLSLLSSLPLSLPPLPHPHPWLHCYHRCGLCQLHHAFDAPVDGWLLCCLSHLTCCVVRRPNVLAPAVMQFLTLLLLGGRPLLPKIASHCPVALALSIDPLCGYC
jgi:hypothetical protein